MEMFEQMMNYYKHLPRGQKSMFVQVLSFELGLKTHNVSYLFRNMDKKPSYLTKPTMQRISELMVNDSWQTIWNKLQG